MSEPHTPREWSAKAMSRFKEAAFDPDAVAEIEKAYTQVIELAVQQERDQNRRKLEMFGEMAAFVEALVFYAPALRARQYDAPSTTVNGLMDTAEDLLARAKELS